MPICRRRCFAAALLLQGMAAASAHAGNTGGVFGPVIQAGDRSLQYRYANALGENGAADNFAHRLHAQYAFNRHYRARVVAQYRDQPSGSTFDQLRLELQHQFIDSRQTGGIWNSALRGDLVIRDDKRPEDIGLHWTNQWTLSERWQATALLFTIRQTGDNRLPGVQVSSRYRLAYRYHDAHSVALESYNSHGPLNALGIPDAQPQQAGPALSGQWQQLGYKLAYLRGLNSATPTETLSLWLTLPL